MSLSLFEIYTATKNTYHLQLLEGKDGLSRIMDWVYISEDGTTAKFLRGGELIITTGVSSSGPDWLYTFIDTMIQSGTCGIIINIGKYIKPVNITPEIRSLCAQNNYPIFTMPWHIHIYDITHDYYNRLFHDTQTDCSITDILLNCIRKKSLPPEYQDTLEAGGFPAVGPYCVCLLQGSPQKIDPALRHRLLLQLETFFQNSSLTGHVIWYKSKYLLIFRTTSASSLKKLLPPLLTQLRQTYSCLDLHLGTGSLAESLSDLPVSFYRAAAALTLALHNHTPLVCFEDLGFYRLLLSISDMPLLQNYMQEYLGPILAYDEAHNSSYTETLHQYILLNGHINAIAAALYCHRNTIAYRVHHLRTLLYGDLSDPTVRFNLMTAFLIRDYLTIIRETS